MENKKFYLRMGATIFTSLAATVAFFFLLFRSQENPFSTVSTVANGIVSVGFIGGKLLDSLIVGIICFICLTVMKMPYGYMGAGPLGNYRRRSAPVVESFNFRPLTRPDIAEFSAHVPWPPFPKT